MDRGTVICTIVFAWAFVNQIFVYYGFYKIPGTSDDWEMILTNVFTFITATIAWFKNNYITVKGKKQKEVLKANNLTKAK
ncbi:phage holin [Niallia nealsonii]|uniref:Phage holin n=1 Tax=Niallia nealsonii TaxID=115979 RepID=A0A2N0Z4G3_9BACI|nr:phage holin [Niallia nealsonii]PKG24390.1 phage holin [Niallia nealsonii]